MMPFEYLGPETDYRMLFVAGYLWDKIADKVIVDLDCLQARLWHYLPRTYAEYISNDIYNHKDRPRAITFYQITDAEMAKQVDRCDILLVFGHNGKDNENISQSICRIVEKCHPQYIVLETIERYAIYIEDIASMLSGYILDQNVRITPIAQLDRLHNRRIMLLRRSDV